MQPARPPYPPPLGAQPPWLGLLEDGQGAGPSGAAEGPLPGEGWPRLESIDYVSKLITLIILLLALPWLIGKLISDPAHASGHAASFAQGHAR